MKLRNRIVLLVIGFFAIVMVGVFLRSLLNRDEIIASLPDDAKIIGVYRNGGFGNGDYMYALKVNISKSSFEDFAKNQKLSSKAIDPTSVIGYNLSNSDVPRLDGWDWGEVANPESKYYRMDKRSYVRSTYSNGFMYYYTRGW